MAPKARKEQLFGPETQVELYQENPKRRGSASYDRYEKYKVGKTVQEVLSLGGAPGDLANDYKMGYLTCPGSGDATSGASGSGSTASSSTASSSNTPAAGSSDSTACSGARGSGKNASRGAGRSEAARGSADAAPELPAAEAAQVAQAGPRRRLQHKSVEEPAGARKKKKLLTAAKAKAIARAKGKPARKGKAKGKGKGGRCRVSDDELAYRLFIRREKANFPDAPRESDNSKGKGKGKGKHKDGKGKSKSDKNAAVNAVGNEDLRRAWVKCDRAKRAAILAEALEIRQEIRKKEEAKRKRGPAVSAFSKQLVLKRMRLRIKDLPTMRNAMPSWSFPKVLPTLQLPPEHPWNAPKLQDGPPGEHASAGSSRGEDASAKVEETGKSDLNLAEILMEAAAPADVARAAMHVFDLINDRVVHLAANIRLQLDDMMKQVSNLADHVDPHHKNPSKSLAQLWGGMSHEEKPQDGASLSKHLFAKCNEYPPQIQFLMRACPQINRKVMASMLRTYWTTLQMIGSDLQAGGEHSCLDLLILMSNLNLDVEGRACSKKDAKMKTFRRAVASAQRLSVELTQVVEQGRLMMARVTRQSDLKVCFPGLWILVKAKAHLTSERPLPPPPGPACQRLLEDAGWPAAGTWPPVVQTQAGVLGERWQIGKNCVIPARTQIMKALVGVDPLRVFAQLPESEWQEVGEDVLFASQLPDGPKAMEACGRFWSKINRDYNGIFVTAPYKAWAEDGSKPELEVPCFEADTLALSWFCTKCQAWQSKFEIACGRHGGCGNPLGRGVPARFGPLSSGDSFGLSLAYNEGDDGSVRLQLRAQLTPIVARLSWASYWPPDKLRVSFRLCHHDVPTLPSAPPVAAEKAGAFGQDELEPSEKRQRFYDEDEDWSLGSTGQEFTLASCADAECAPQPPGFRLPLFVVQQRTLGWMRDREEQPLEYVSRETLRRRFLGSDVDVELRVDRHWRSVRGGVLADSVGYGKTACMIGLIQAGLKRPLSDVLTPTELEDLSRRFIVSNATLVITPPNLFEQWLEEFRKFLAPSTFDECRIVEIPSIHRLNKLSVEDLANADVVVVPYRFFFSHSYEKFMDETIGWTAGADTAAAATRKENKGDVETGKETGKEARKKQQTLRYVILRDFMEKLLRKHATASGETPASSSSSRCSAAPATAGTEAPRRKTVAGQELSVDLLERMAPTLEVFFWRRVVFDEFHEVLSIHEGRPYHALRQCFAKFHWGLTATPRLGSPQDVVAMASLLHISLPPSSHVESQHFLDEWVRSSTWDTSTVPLENRIVPVRHARQERLLYLHQRNAVSNRGGGKQAEEHLLQLCSHFNPGAEVAEAEIGATAAVSRRRADLHKELEDVQTSLAEAEASLPGQQRRCDAAARLRTAFQRLGLRSGVQARGADLSVGDSKRISGEHSGEDLEVIVATLEPHLPPLEEQPRGGAEPRAPPTLSSLPPDVRSLLQDLAKLVARTKERSYREKFTPNGRELEGYCAALDAQVGRQQQQIEKLERSVRFFENTFKCLKDEGEEIECPVCLENVEPNLRAITSCGHIFHEECIRMVVEDSKACPTCRCALAPKDIALIHEVLGDEREKAENADRPAEAEAPEHGSKMAKIVETLREVRKQEPGAKIIMFCQWERILKFIAATMEKLGEHRPLVLRGALAQRQATIRDFVHSESPKHSVLLLSLEKSPTGMNLVSCHHLFLVHPMYAPSRERAVATELQAIGRLRRQGQKSRVTVHRFVTRGTIEEEISSRHQTHLDEVDVRRRQEAQPASGSAGSSSSSAGGAGGGGLAGEGGAGLAVAAGEEVEGSEVQAAVRAGL